MGLDRAYNVNIRCVFLMLDLLHSNETQVVSSWMCK